MWALDARTEPTTLLAVVDPTDTVRALARTANVPTLPYATLLGEIDRASGRAGGAATDDDETTPCPEEYGCVDRFDCRRDPEPGEGHEVTVSRTGAELPF